MRNPWIGEKWRMKDASKNKDLCLIVSGDAIRSENLQNMVIYQYDGSSKFWVSELMAFVEKFEFVDSPITLSSWIKTSEQLPAPNTQVLVSYLGGVYLGYWQSSHNPPLGKSEPEWKIYNVGGVQDAPTPDFWMNVPPIPKY